MADRYELLDRLGEGGHGEVYRALDRNRAMYVALKLLTQPDARPLNAYWEASLLTSLHGPNILEVFDAGSSGDVPFLATAIAASGTTQDQLDRHPFGIRPDVVLTWIRHALLGLRTVHDLGVLHADIKPSNLFLDRMDWAKLGDFSIARIVEADGHAPAAGTPLTMAPELFHTGRMSTRSDLYSLAITAYVLLKGDWPFWADDTDELPAVITAGAHEPLNVAVPHLPLSLARRLERNMAANPTDRDASAEAMLVSLSRPGLLSSIWQRETPHQDHSKCWVELVRPGGGTRGVCVIRNGARSDIEVTFTGSGRRVPGSGARAVEARRMPAELARTFRRLAS